MGCHVHTTWDPCESGVDLGIGTTQMTDSPRAPSHTLMPCHIMVLFACFCAASKYNGSALQAMQSATSIPRLKAPRTFVSTFLLQFRHSEQELQPALSLLQNRLRCLPHFPVRMIRDVLSLEGQCLLVSKHEARSGIVVKPCQEEFCFIRLHTSSSFYSKIETVLIYTRP